MAKTKQDATPTDPTDAAQAGVAVATIPDTPKSVAPAMDFAALAADAAEAGQTFERDDIAIPFLRVAQALSPQLKRNEAVFIDGLAEGDLFNTVTREIFRDGDGKPEMILVPVMHTNSYVEFWPRNSKEGQGFIMDHGTNAAVLEGTTKDDKFRDITPQGTEIVHASLYYVLQIDPVSGRYTQAAMALSRTARKAARRWNALMSALRVSNPNNPAESLIPAPYYQAYRVTTATERKNADSWAAYRIDMFQPTHELPNGPAIYAAAKELLKMVKAGSIKANMEGEATTAAAETGNKEDGDLPF